VLVTEASVVPSGGYKRGPSVKLDTNFDTNGGNLSENDGGLKGKEPVSKGPLSERCRTVENGAYQLTKPLLCH
jgi:hypothetical protein